MEHNSGAVRALCFKYIFPSFFFEMDRQTAGAKQQAARWKDVGETADAGSISVEKARKVARSSVLGRTEWKSCFLVRGV